VGLGGIAGTAASALGGARLERARWKVEARRLHEQRREDERRDRRAAYLRYCVLFNSLDTYATGYPPSDDDALTATLRDYNDAIAAMDLFGTADVREALNEVRKLTRSLAAGMGPAVEAGSSLAEALVSQWRVHRARLVSAEGTVVDAMRQDVGPLPTDPPD